MIYEDVTFIIPDKAVPYTGVESDRCDNDDKTDGKQYGQIFLVYFMPLHSEIPPLMTSILIAKKKIVNTFLQASRMKAALPFA
jgi:hypothetical protein